MRQPRKAIIAKWSFSQFASNPNAFCAYQAFDKDAPFICAGGGRHGSGGSCDPTACATGQYAFPGNNTWRITTRAATAYRAAGDAQPECARAVGGPGGRAARTRRARAARRAGRGLYPGRVLSVESACHARLYM